MSYELQCLDCNCNDCFYMKRDLNKKNEQDVRFMASIGKKSDAHYGFCSKFESEIKFYPNLCSLETQQCFKHRKDNQPQ